MNKRLFIELLARKLKGESTPTEDEFLEKYYELFETEPEVLDLLDAGEKTAVKTEIYESILKDIQPGGTIGKVRRIRRGLVIKIAAAALLFVVCITAIYLSTVTRMHPGVASRSVNTKHENHLVLLADGSTVIVSWGSKFHASRAFGLNNREVYLEGEAYFDIRHNPAKPFIVHTGNLATTVLGTAFNVKAMPGEENITVTVSRGKVKISDLNNVLGIITRGQQITYNKKKISTVEESVDVQSRIGWKEQDLFVDNVTVREAAVLLGERYGVLVEVNDSLLANDRFTTVFSKKETIDQVLKSICAFTGADYIQNNEKAAFVITRKRQD